MTDQPSQLLPQRQTVQPPASPQSSQSSQHPQPPQSPVKPPQETPAVEAEALAPVTAIREVDKQPPPRSIPPNAPRPNEQVEKTYTVEDLNSRTFEKPKSHEILVDAPNAPGKKQLKRYTFKPDEPTSMPQTHALVFLDISPSFRVRNSLGQIVRPRRFMDGNVRTVELRPHEVAVPITLIIKSALYDMARALPGGEEKFNKGDGHYSRDELAEFVISGGTVDEDDEGNPLLDTVAA